MRALITLVPLLAAAGCAGAALDGMSPGRDASTRVAYLEAEPDEVWLELYRVLQDLRIPVADGLPGAGQASLRTEPFPIAPDDVHCGARPSGQEPLMRSPVARMRVDLQRWGGARTEAELRVEVQGSAVEPRLVPSREACVSRGTLERRILQRVADRLGEA